MRLGWLIIEAQSEYAMRDYTLRELRVTDTRNAESRTIRQFQLIEWPELAITQTGSPILDAFIDFLSQVRMFFSLDLSEIVVSQLPISVLFHSLQVHKTREQFGLEGPIAVHCASGGGRSGAFIALSIALERVRAEGLVDVFQTARLLRIQRAALVQLPQYYIFLYYALLAYLGAMVEPNEQ